MIANKHGVNGDAFVHHYVTSKMNHPDIRAHPRFMHLDFGSTHDIVIQSLMEKVPVLMTCGMVDTEEQQSHSKGKIHSNCAPCSRQVHVTIITPVMNDICSVHIFL